MNSEQQLPKTCNLKPETYRASGASRGSRGMTILLVIGFMGIFSIILGTVTSYVFQQAKYGRALYAREQALSIAESGLEYYKWYLAHNPSVLLSGAGLVTPYVYTVSDPEAGTVGSATITATPNLQCGVLQSLDLSSRGVSNASVTYPRTLLARYMKRSIAEYAYLYKSVVWFGSTNVGIGPYHSNNGIRMDGSNNSVVLAGVSTVWCDGTSGSLGCNGVSPNPSPGWKNGVFGLGSGGALWQFPATTIDFDAMAVNFSTLKTYAQTSGLLLGTSTVRLAGVQQGASFSNLGGTEALGYHLRFLSDGRVEVWRVTGTNANTNNTNRVRSYNSVDGWRYNHIIITSESLKGTYTLPAGCKLIYAEAKTWIEGTVSGKLTLIAADSGSFAPDIILHNNIAYATTDGTTGLTAVAEDSIHYGLVIPTNMSVRGIFVAQSGQYGRDLFQTGTGYLPSSSYNQYVVRNSLTTTGTLVSSQRGGLCWGGTPCTSGFLSRTNNYDRILAFSPPPFTPAASADWGLQLWREQ